MLALVVIFTTLHKDSTILLSIFIKLYTRSLGLFCKFVPFNNKYEEVKLDIDDCGIDGCEVDNNGVIIRWEE